MLDYPNGPRMRPDEIIEMEMGGEYTIARSRLRIIRDFNFDPI